MNNLFLLNIYYFLLFAVLYDNDGNVIAENDNGDDLYIICIHRKRTYFTKISVSRDFDYADLSKKVRDSAFLYLMLDLKNLGILVFIVYI